MSYLLDSNVFIEAHRNYYAFDLCPGFWDSVIWHHENGRLMSLDKVRAEIVHETDALVDWIHVKMPSSGFAVSSDAEVITEFGKIQAWANAQTQFTDAARSEFASVADAWLVAYAKIHNLILVTHEVFSADAKKRIPLPNVCKAFDVNYTNTFKMLRSLEVQFAWKSPA